MEINKYLREYINSIPVTEKEDDSELTVSTLIDILFYSTVDYRMILNEGRRLVEKDKSLNGVSYYMGSTYGIDFRFLEEEIKVYGNNSDNDLDFDSGEIPLTIVKKFLSDNKNHIQEALKILGTLNHTFNTHRKERFNPSDVKQTIKSGELSVTISLLGTYTVTFRGVDITKNDLFIENSEFIFENILVTDELIPEFKNICETSMNPATK